VNLMVLSMYKIKPRTSTKASISERILDKVQRVIVENPRRSKIRQMFLNLPPSGEVNRRLPYTLHSLVCSRDLDMGICSTKTLNLACQQNHRWVFHDDGTLTANDIRKLEYHLPGSMVITRNEADKYAKETLGQYPKILEYRHHQIMALKLIDVKLWTTEDKLGYVDTDICFFKNPEFYFNILQGLDDKSYFNRDMKNSYVKSPASIQTFLSLKPKDCLNAGLWAMRKSVIDFRLIEKWLNHPEFSTNLYDYTLDQTFISILAQNSKLGAEYLPTSYDVDLSKVVNNGSIVKHYVGAIRHGFELEGLFYLLKYRNFIERWKKFINK